MDFSDDFESFVYSFSVLWICIFTTVTILAACCYNVGTDSADVGELEEPATDDTTLGFGQCTGDLTSGPGEDRTVGWEIGEGDNKTSDGESERETEEEDETAIPGEDSSADESMPELEDIAKKDTDKPINLTQDENDAADDIITTEHGNENGSENAAERKDEEKVENIDGGEEKVNEAYEATKEEEEQRQEKESCSDVVKEQKEPNENDGTAEIRAKSEDGKEREEKQTEASAPDPVVAKKGDGTTKVLRKKKKKKTRSQLPSLFSCPFMTPDMMEPSESRGPWRRRERGKPRERVNVFLAEGNKSKEDQKEDTVTEVTQNGEDPENGGNAEGKNNSSPAPENDDDVKKVKEEIYEEALPQRKVYKEAERCMTDEDRAAERRIQQEQLAAIFKLMQDNEDKFGVQSYDDVEEQMKLYKT
ncbi:cilia- and flagella-associated protein 251-like [Branchiostoma floridae]|uniref:Cilia- and flagella-associated protein 251-like n=1 Tax=Branchiostoma floridae TaxID=7739 RepID=A0A9J7M9G2_BRAFL|nr:cilia- and flagella-associated protein 251-like [Branchiostoma floridae]